MHAKPLLLARLRCVAYFCLTGALGSIVLLEEEEEGCCHAWSRRGSAVPFLPCKVGLGWGGSGNKDILNPAPDSSVAKPGDPRLCLLGALSQAQVLLLCALVLSFFAEISGASPVLCVPGPPPWDAAAGALSAGCRRRVLELPWVGTGARVPPFLPEAGQIPEAAAEPGFSSATALSWAGRFLCRV